MCKDQSKENRHAVFILDKNVFRAKKITRDREGHYIMIKGSIHQEDIAILNVYIPNTRAAKCMKQKLMELKGEMDKSTIITEDFYNCVSATDRTTWQKMSKNIEELTISQRI